MNEFANSASILYSRGNIQPFVAAVTLFGALVAGTGGVYSSANVLRVTEWTNAPAVAIGCRSIANRERRPNDISIPNAILQTREKLGLRMSELAEIFGVSRQAVYLWLNGENVRPEYVQRIWQVSSIADQVERAGISRPEHFLHRPFSPDGRTLYQSLLAGEDIEAAVACLKADALTEQETRKASSAGLAFRREPARVASSASELSRPIMDESNG